MGTANVGIFDPRYAPLVKRKRWVASFLFGFPRCARMKYAVIAGQAGPKPKIIAVIGGLLTVMLLNLRVVPAAFTYVDDVEVWFKRRLGRPARPVALAVVETQGAAR
jgi:hypothetical protein